MLFSSFTPQRRAVTFWLVVGFVVVAVHAMWSLTIPLMASPDEPSHAVRAVAVAHGQWSGALGSAPTDGTRPGAPTVVRVPDDYAELIVLPNCFAFHADQPASCQPAITPSTGKSVAVETYSGQYPPLYYALVGWPSLFLGAHAGTYAMRMVSGAVASLFLVWGMAGLRRSTLPTAAVWGSLVSVTPMALFLGATINPQALEVASAFAFWSACIALATSPGRPTRATFVQAAVSGAVLLNSRASGPVWAVVAVAVCLLLAPRGRLRELWAVRATSGLVGVGVVSGLIAALWLATHGDVVTSSGLFPQYASPLVAAHAVLGFSHAYLVQIVGDFGWLDAPTPPVTNDLWFVVTGMLLLLAMSAPARRRAVSAVALAALAVVAAPFALQVPSAGDTGIIWQGRYALPVAVGVSLVAAAVLTEVGDFARRLMARVLPLIIAAVVVAHVGAFWWALRRYSTGLDGEVFTLTPRWSSPLGYLPAVALYTVLAAAAGILAWCGSRGSGRAQEPWGASRPRTDVSESEELV